MYFLARKEKATIYHFHDPELIITGFLLKLTGATVIFDVHENIAMQIKIKHYLPLASLFSRLFKPINYISARCFSLVLAENSYEDIYKRYTRRYEIILNMPDIDFLEPHYLPDRDGCRDLFYIGRVSKARGCEVSLEALRLLKQDNIHLNLHVVGNMDPALRMEMENLDYYNEIKDNVIFYGPKSLPEGFALSRQCLAGLSVLSPVENYLNSYSTKVFEYMAAAMPVITSNFQLYKDVVERYDCGLCIDPTQPRELADAVRYLLDHPDRAREMGKNGRTAAQHLFNWRVEEKKLLEFYESVSV
jgi:glycosyltransferase involved in cell wall biosynthesis